MKDSELKLVYELGRKVGEEIGYARTHIHLARAKRSLKRKPEV